MIKVFRSQHIDDTKWNACVSNAFNESIYGYTWYLQALDVNWIGLVYGNYEMVMPLVFKTKYGLSYLCRVPMHQRTAIYSQSVLSAEQIKLFFLHIPPKYMVWNFCVDEYSVPTKYATTEEPNLIIPLNSSHEELKNHYNKNTKRNVAASAKFGVEVRRGGSVSTLLDTFKKYRANKVGLVLSDFEYQGISRFMTSLLASGHAHLYEAYLNNEYLGSAFIGVSARRLYYLFSAVTHLGAEKKAMFAINHAIINEYQSTTYVLDFEGSKLPGVAQFYSGFGAKSEKYYTVSYYRFGLFKYFSGK